MAGERKKRSFTGAVDKPRVPVKHKGEEKQFARDEISSMVPTKKRQIATDYHGSTVKNAAVTIPANLSESQPQATKDARNIGGLNVMQIISEPSAAATVYRVDKKTSAGEKHALVLNLGSGVSEVSLTFKVKDSAGNTHLGAEDSHSRTVNVQFAQEFDQDNQVPSLSRSTRHPSQPHQSVQESDTDDHFQTLPPRSTKHPSHPDHKLLWKTDKEYYICDGCQMKGFGPRYSCKPCSFDLHEKCMSGSEASPATCHDLVGNSTFKFLYRRPGRCTDASCTECYRRCEACAKPTKGFVYYQEGKDRGITFHPCCFTLPSKLIAEEIEYELCANLSSKCLLCKRRQLEGTVTGNTGWAYVSKCKKYNFHVYCVMEMSVEKGKDGDLSLVAKNKKLPIEKHDKKISKKVISFFKILLSILLGDPISLAVTVVDMLVN